MRPDEELALSRALEECLGAMDRGESDLDSLARRYPHCESEIRPLLDVALQLKALRNRARPISPRFVEDLRRRLETHPVARTRA